MASTAKGQRLAFTMTERDHVQGPPAAKVTVLEYGDYLCTGCLKAVPILLELQRQTTGGLRFVFRHFPLTTLRPYAQRAAEAAEAAAAQGKFWAMHDYLLGHQDSLDDGHLAQYAAEIGLDVRHFTRDLETHAHSAKVREDVMSGVRGGVSDTPTFFINGERYFGPSDLQPLLAAIREALRDERDSKLLG